MNRPSIGRARRVSGNALSIVAAFVLISSSIMKFAGVPFVTGPLAKLGFYGDRLLLIAALELASGMLFIVPRTRSAGVVLASAYMGGAIAAHLGHGESIVQPALVLGFIWSAVLVRNPEALWSVEREERTHAAELSSRSLAA
jgi:DoxX-like protein